MIHLCLWLPQIVICAVLFCCVNTRLSCQQVCRFVMQSWWRGNTAYRSQLFGETSAQTAILLSLPASLLLLSLPRHFPQIRWCDARSEPFLLPSSPVVPPARTPTQASHHSKRSGMWPCMSYTRLICFLMGNVLFSRSRREQRFKRWSEIRFSFFSVFPLLTEEYSVFTLPTF